MNLTTSGQAAVRIHAFLGKARRRIYLRLALWSLFWAALISEAWAWGTMAANRYLNAGLPVYTIGYLLAAVLLFIHWRRMRPAAVAARADRRLGLKDRLVSYLDFSGRPEVDPAFRVAQAEETAEAIGAADLARGFRIHPLLWVSPAVFLVLMTWFLFEKIPGNPLVTVRSVLNIGFRESGSPPKKTGTEDANKESGPTAVITTLLKEKEAPKDDGKDISPENRPPDRPPESKPEEKEKGDARNRLPPSEQIFQPPTDAASAAGGVKRPRGGTDLDTVQLFSETVGKELTPVATAGNPAGLDGRERTAPAPPRGRQAFNLIPRSKVGASGKKGIGIGGGEADKTLEITVDFDAVPVEYRDFVRRYFLELQKGG